MLGFLANDVDDVVDGDTADNAIIVVDNRSRQQVTILEFPNNLRGGRMGRYRHHLRRHYAGYQGIGIVREQSREKKRPHVFVIAIDHEQQVGSVRHFADRAQVAHDDFQSDIGTDRHDVDVHKAAGAVFVVGENLLQAIVVGLVQRLQDLPGNRLRKVRQEVGEVVEVHACGCGDELLGLHVFDQAVAHLVAQFDKNVALVVGRDHFPQNGAFLEWQRFEETCGFGWMQAVYHQPC